MVPYGSIPLYVINNESLNGRTFEEHIYNPWHEKDDLMNAGLVDGEMLNKITFKTEKRW